MTLVALATTAVSATAQLSWVNGFVVTNEGDTLQGQVQVNTPAVTSAKMVFKSETVDKIVHKPFQIKAWGSDDGTVYESKAYQLGKDKYGVFMRRHTAVGGEVQCYEYWNTDGNGTTGFSQLFMEKQQEMTEVYMGKFKKQMSEYFADNEAIVAEINEGKYKKTLDGLIELIEAYNASKNKRWD